MNEGIGKEPPRKSSPCFSEVEDTLERGLWNAEDEVSKAAQMESGRYECPKCGDKNPHPKVCVSCTEEGEGTHMWDRYARFQHAIKSYEHQKREIALRPHITAISSLINEAEEGKQPIGKRGGYLQGKLIQAMQAAYDFVSFDKEIHIYQEGEYLPGGNAKLRAAVREIISRVDSEARIASVALLREVEVAISDTSQEDRKKLLGNGKLCCLNGVLDVGSMEFEMHHPKHKFISKLGVWYDSGATCPRIHKFLREIGISKGECNALFEVLGQALMQERLTHTIVMLIGRGGTGKGTLISLIREFFGDNNVRGIPLQQLETNRFILATLYGKYANLFSDLPNDALRTTGFIKTLVGGDWLTADVKFGKAFQFTYNGAMIFSCNEAPAIGDDSGAFWRRLLLFECNTQFNAILGNENTGMLKEIAHPDELSGLLNEVLAGYKRIKGGAPLSVLKTPEEIRGRYLSLSDSLRSFIALALEGLDSYKEAIGKEAFYNAYLNFCEERKLMPYTKEKVGRDLPKITGCIHGKRGPAGQQYQAWLGLKWSQEWALMGGRNE